MKEITKSFLRSLITEGKLELALQRLLNLFKSFLSDNNDDEISLHRDSLMLLAFRINDINKQFEMGVIFRKNLTVEINNIASSTLELIKDLPNTVFSPRNLQKEQRVERSDPGLRKKQIIIQNEHELNSGDHKKNKKKKEEEFIQEMKKIKAFSEQIEGYWWEKVLPADDSALSFVLIKEEDETKKLKFSGKTYGVDGVIIAKWHSISCCVDLSQTSVFYIWNGWHHKEPSVLKNGWGKIDFTNKNIGEGKFSDVIPALKIYENKTVTMQSCSEKEIEIMLSGNPVKRQELILEKLVTIE